MEETDWSKPGIKLTEEQKIEFQKDYDDEMKLQEDRIQNEEGKKIFRELREKFDKEWDQ